MVDKICDYLTNKIRNKMPEVDDERAEIINYGIHLIVGEIPKTFIFIVVAWLLGVFKEFCITMLVIFPYRAVSGGFHLKTHLGCITLTTIYYCGIAYVSRLFVIPIIAKNILIALVWIFGIIMCKLYAPADTESVPILRKKERKIKQILSYAILTITLIIGIFINNTTVSNIIILGMFVQSIMISRLAYKLTKNEYGHEVYEKEKLQKVA